MTITAEDLRRIVTHLESFGEMIPEDDRTSIGHIVQTLIQHQTPEMVEMQILVASQASAVVGFLEKKWSGIAKRQDAVVDSVKARVGRLFRESAKATGTKITEAQVSENACENPDVMLEESKLTYITEVAEILESLRYAIKNRFDGLLELSRNERVSSRTGV